MSQTKSEQVNMVWLAGKLKFDPKVHDNAVKALIDTGQKQAVQVGCFRDADEALANKLARFREGDSIKIVATLEPYGVKQADGTWKNGMAVRITEIKTEPPARPQKQEKQMPLDDGIPF